MRLIFMGTPVFAVPALEALHAAGHEIVAVYTRAPQPAGRGKSLQKSAVHVRAEALGLRVLTPKSLKNPEQQTEFASFGADLAVVAAYGLLLPVPVLEAPVRGCVNIHASLLPRWRGAAPVQRAILAGDAETGVTIMQMEQGLDTGPMLLREATEIGGKTAGALFEELSAMGARLVLQVLEEGPEAVVQPAAGVTLAPKLSKAEARLDFSLAADALVRVVNAFNPAPGAFAELAGERVKILRAEAVAGRLEPGQLGVDMVTGTGAGLLRPLLVQRAGRPAMTPAEMLRGWALPADARMQ